MINFDDLEREMLMLGIHATASRRFEGEHTVTLLGSGVVGVGCADSLDLATRRALRDFREQCAARMGVSMGGAA